MKTKSILFILILNVERVIYLVTCSSHLTNLGILVAETHFNHHSLFFIVFGPPNPNLSYHRGKSIEIAFPHFSDRFSKLKMRRSI